MDYLRKYWPYSFKMVKGNVKRLVWTVVIYALITMGAGLATWPLGFIPAIGSALASIISFAIDAYCGAGIVFSFLCYFEVGPFKN